MRRLLCLILSLFITLSVNAAEHSGINTTVADAWLADADKNVFENISMDFNKVIDNLRSTDPEFVWFLEHMVEESKKKNVVKSYVGYKTYGYYKTKFLADLGRRSKETGREIKTLHFKSTIDRLEETHYWLDRGRLDEPECHLNNDVKDFYTCQFPDGFENFYVVIQTYFPPDDTPEARATNGVDLISGNSGLIEMRLYMHKDIPSDNTSMAVNVLVHSNNIAIEHDQEPSYDSLIEGRLSVGVSSNVRKYSDEQAMRNKMAEDVLRTGDSDAAVMQSVVPGGYVTSYSMTQLGHSVKRGAK